MFRKRYGGLKMPVTSHWLFFTVFYACSTSSSVDNELTKSGQAG